jgi:hypothetical protein
MHCIRIYGKPETGYSISNIEGTLGRGVMTLNDNRETKHRITLPPELVTRGNPTDIGLLPAVQGLLGEANVKHLQVYPLGALDMSCTFHRALNISHTFSLPSPKLLSAWTPPPLPVAKECPVCSEPTTAIPLSCGHIYCSTCFYHQTCTAISDATTSSHFPLKCWASGCEAPIPLVDLQTHLIAHHFILLLTTALNLRIRQHPDKYRACARPDCPCIYPPKTGFLTTCSLCYSQSCPTARNARTSPCHAPNTAASFTHPSSLLVQKQC